MQTRKETYCSNDYICPKNSYRIPGHQCYDSFEDCECNDGYEKSTKKDKCTLIKPQPTHPPTNPPVCSNDYVCPKNSCRIPGLSCYDSFEDCKCDDGYEKSNKKDKCIPIKPQPTRPPTHPPVCLEYICPKHSFRIPGLPCYDSFEDCKCDDGYEKSTKKDKCIPIKPQPTRPPTQPPTHPPVCLNDYVCPKDSRRIEGRECYDGFEDCNCKDGYERIISEEKCSPKTKKTRPPIHPPTDPPIHPPTIRLPVCWNDYVCPANSYRIPGRDCYDAFDDCQCNSGYYKSTKKDKCFPIRGNR